LFARIPLDFAAEQSASVVRKEEDERNDPRLPMLP
jgi:hypothetical protein